MLRMTGDRGWFVPVYRADRRIFLAFQRDKVLGDSGVRARDGMDQVVRGRDGRVDPGGREALVPGGI